MKFKEWLQIQENNQRTGSKIGLYPPAYTLSQYPDAYYVPIAADYVTYHDIEKKNPSDTIPKSDVRFKTVSINSKGKIKKETQTP